MSHTIHNKDKLLARIRRIKGQVEGIEKALEAELPCAEVLRRLASVKGAMNGLTAEVMEGHLFAHVVSEPDEKDRTTAALEMIEVIRSYVK